MNLPCWRLGGVIAVSLAVTGCGFLKNKPAEQKASAEPPFKELSAPVSIRRDYLGIPLVEANNNQDLYFALGYVAASDRLSQMISTKLTAEGRMAEWLGESAIELDKYMRAMDLKQAARNQWNAATPEQKKLLQRYADGVNAYISTGTLPESMRSAAYEPDPWLPTDSLAVIALYQQLLSTNLQEEIAFLRLAQTLGLQKAAWLIPVYPDQPLPFDEARKLAEVNLNGFEEAVDRLLLAQEMQGSMGLSGIAASNNWAVHKSRTKGGASIIASDPHLPMAMPSAWHFVHARTPDTQWAGVSLAGMPGPIMGYNGHIAWGGTMVMGDNQDIYLEKMHVFWDKLHYFYKGEWFPAEERKEIFRVKDRSAQVHTYYATRHGTLLNNLLQKPAKAGAIPPSLKLTYGLAFQSTISAPAGNPLVFDDIARAKTVDEAKTLMKQVKGLPFNMVFGDKDNIAWQVTGSYPVRKKGRGQVPSPGWTGEYDWDGYLDPEMHPASLNPAEGYIGTANQRIVAADFPHTLSSSWFYPERAERINQMLSQDAQHTADNSIKMQLDQQSPLVAKVQAWLKAEENKEKLEQAINALNKTRKAKANEALSALLEFDGKLSSDSMEAAIYSAFLHSFTRRTFLDELGPASSENWKAFVRISNISYSAPMDHLLVRGDDSPFWDDVKTAKKETKEEIIAESLADAIVFLEKKLERKRIGWNWGALHTYHWKTDATVMAPKVSLKQKIGLEKMDAVLNRGPFAAGGDHTTLNISSYNLGADFDTWMIPSMRMIVDFSREEPMMAMNSSGQSADPTSRHYDDSIKRFLAGEYLTFPFKQENIDQTYAKAMILQPSK
ncbi:MAG TPA: penicillin acylase family protein [Noviherbaspirillum sp.]|nr:penicillin acylase family protein [Noviherbaspirillum sp.]